MSPVAQVHVESAWDTQAVSPAGATGLAQFMPGTAAWIQKLYPKELECASGKGCPLSAGWALRALSLYDKRLFEDMRWALPEERFPLALVCYNGGQGWLLKEREAARRQGLTGAAWWGAIETVCLRAAWACKESRAYPRKILDVWQPPYARWLREA